MRFILIDTRAFWDNVLGFFPDASTCDAAARMHVFLTDGLGGPVCLALGSGGFA